MRKMPLTEAQFTDLEKEFPDIDLEYIYTNQFEPWLSSIPGDPESNLFQQFRYFLRTKLRAYEGEENRILLNVPFQEKDEAKRRGAEWDYVNRSWYVHAGVDLLPFQKWLRPREVEQTLAARVDGLEALGAQLRAEIAGLKTAVAFLSRQLDSLTVAPMIAAKLP